MVSLKCLELSQLPPIQEAQRQECCLYVVQEGGESHFKIGVAFHPARRLSGLQAGNRRRLAIVAAYAGTRANCLYVEKVALKFFRAAPGSEWVWVEHLSEIAEFLNAFCQDAA